MKERKKMLEKFINDYFNLEKINVVWKEDFFVEVYDGHDVLTLIAFCHDTIFALLDGEKLASYKLSRDRQDQEFWKVVNYE